MSQMGYINFSLEIFGALLSVILILFLLSSKQKKNRQDRCFIRILIVHCLVLLSDAMAWLFKGGPGPVSLWVVHCANFFVFSLGYVLMAVFTDYLIVFLNARGAKVPAWVSRLFWGFAALGVALVILSQFNRMYYLIDAANVYQRQPLFWLSQLLGIVGMVFSSTLLIAYRRVPTKRDLFFLSSYIALPALAMCVQSFVYGVALLYITTSVCITSIYLFIQVEQAHLNSQREVELEKNRAMLMLSQIQPHFLSNCLVCIQQLCHIDPDKAATALTHFSIFLRSNLDSLSVEGLIPFAQEVSHVRDYLYLERMRFEDRLQVVWKLEYQSFSLPPLTLQPIVENAVRHGIMTKEQGGTVTIESRQTHSAVVVTIRDDGIGFAPEGTRHNARPRVGLENVRTRLALYCGASLSIESVAGQGTQISLVFPQQAAVSP